MKKIYGGLFLENLVAQDCYYLRQCQLFQSGHIQGVQLRVAHPCFTPVTRLADLPKIISALPEGMEVFIHHGAENVGVDIGETFDELGVFAQRSMGTGKCWSEWNVETIDWGFEVALAADSQDRVKFHLPGVIHPGYIAAEVYTAERCIVEDDLAFADAEAQIINRVEAYCSRGFPALETVPRIVARDWYDIPTRNRMLWLRDRYITVGGTPEEMTRALKIRGQKWKCLLDFTHIVVTENQWPFVGTKKPEDLIIGFMALPHTKICHFSGCPPEGVWVDDHSYMNRVTPEVKEALQDMEAVCLEMRFGSDAEAVIDRFRKDAAF